MDKNLRNNTKGEDGDPAASGFKFSVDPNEDPELALALQLSMEEHLQQEEEPAVVEKSATGASLSPSTSQVQPSTSGDTSTLKSEDEISEDEMLQRAIAMSLETSDIHQIDSGTVINATTSSGGNSVTTRTETDNSIRKETIPDFSFMTEEEQIAWAIELTKHCEPGKEARDVDSPPKGSEFLFLKNEVLRRNQALKDAVCRGDVAAIELALTLGTNPHNLRLEIENQCLSLLGAAAHFGHVEVVRVLITAGLNLESPGEPHPTALHAAATKGHSDIVTLLLETGANKEAKDNDGNTALICAARKGHATCVHQLILSGADINAVASHGCTALHGSSERGHVDVVKLLLQNGVEMNVQDNDGDTALLCAAVGGHADVLKELLEAGANISDKSNKGNQSLHYASGYGHIDAVKLLVKAGADKAFLNNANCTPLDVAVRSGNHEVVEYLMGEMGTDPEEDSGELTASVLAQWKGDAPTSWLLGKPEGKLLNPDDSSDMELRAVVHDGDVTAVKRSLALGANPHITWQESGPDGQSMSLLSAAAILGHLDVVRLLMAAGVSLEGSPGEGHLTALLSAAVGGHPDIVMVLLEAGANLEAKTSYGNTALHLAAQKNCGASLRQLVKFGADVNVTNVAGVTPLHSVAENDDVDSLKHLLEAGANVGCKNNFRMTPLHLAVYKGHVDTVEELLKAGSNITDKDTRGCTSLHSAAAIGHVNVVKKLLESDVNIRDTNNFKDTALHLAAYNGHGDVVKLLLEAGANVSDRNNIRKTPLHMAAFRGHVDTVKELLKADANSHEKDNAECTSLHYAAANGHVDVVKLLLEAGANIGDKDEHELTPLHLAAVNGHVDAVKFLLETGANISAKTSNGQTPLHLAAGNDHTNAVKKLLTAGANVNDTDNRGDTALHWGATSGHVNVIKELLEAGANVTAKNRCRDTPLHFAAYNGRVNAMKKFIQAGADISVKKDDGRTPLHMATLSGNLESLKVLLKAGANFNEKDNNGNTPLHMAADMGLVEALKELLEAGASINEQDNTGHTPLHMAALSRRADIAKVLGEAGADIRARNNKNWMPIHYAIAFGGREMVEYLVKYLGCNPEEDVLEGLTATTIAEWGGDANTLWWLKKHLGALANPDSSRDQGHDWIQIENEYNHTKELLRNGMTSKTSDGHMQDNTGMTIIHWAAKLGYSSLINELIKDCGMYPFVKTYKGETPADLAEQEGHTKIIQVLNNFTTPEIKSTKEGLYEKLLDLICSDDDVKQARDLLWAGAPLTPVGTCATEALTLAMEWNRSRILSLLVAAGAPLTTATGGLSILNKTFRNPDITARTRAFIHRAYYHKLLCEKQNVTDHKELRDGVEQIEKKLVKHKDCSISSRAHWPSRDNMVLSKLLTEATRRNCPLICSLLYQAGGKAFLGKGDESPITAAIENQHWEILKVLVCDMGACPYVYSSKDDLSLQKMPVPLQHEIEQIIYDKERRKLEFFYESRRNDLEKDMARKLLGLQQDLFSIYQCDWEEDARTLRPPQPLTASGNTIIPLSPETSTAGLLTATKRGLPQLIFLLVKVGGVDVDTVLDSTVGTTSLHQAASNGKGECVGILLGLGSDPSRPDHYGHSALHLAAMFGHNDIGQCIFQYKEDKYYTCRAGTTPEDAYSGFEHYLHSYKKCGQRSIENEDINLCTDATQATEKLLNCLDWGQLLNEPNRIRMNFATGEAKTVKDAVLNELKIMCDTVEETSNIFKGELRLGGSSSDGTKLYCPDEVDVNLVLDKNLVNSIKVVDQEDQALFNSGHTKVFEVKTDNPYLEGDNLMNEFHDLIQKYLEGHRLVDERLSLVPPGVAKTQVGVALHLAWQGKEYPLLLIGVDLVPVVEVPWIEQLSRPHLTPPGRETFHISNTSDGFWRGSFAGVEAAVLKQLDPQELRVYLICKILLSCMKPEPWMSAKKKNLYTWWSRRDWRISMPTTFALKNAFFRCLERKRKSNMEWPEEKLLHWVSQVFGEMCRDFDPMSNNLECREHTKIRPYFAEDFQQPKNGAGAPEIVRYLSKMMQGESERVREMEKQRKREINE